jgi:hypothetical protein
MANNPIGCSVTLPSINSDIRFCYTYLLADAPHTPFFGRVNRFLFFYRLHMFFIFLIIFHCRIPNNRRHKTSVNDIPSLDTRMKAVQNGHFHPFHFQRCYRFFFGRKVGLEFHIGRRLYRCNKITCLRMVIFFHNSWWFSNEDLLAVSILVPNQLVAQIVLAKRLAPLAEACHGFALVFQSI